jgi:hypothetical protein
VRPAAARPAIGRGQGAARGLRCPDHKHRAAEPGQALTDPEYLPTAGPQRIACEVVSHTSIGLRLPKPAIHQPRPASGVWPSSRRQPANGMRSAAAWPASQQIGLPAIAASRKFLPGRPAGSARTSRRISRQAGPRAADCRPSARVRRYGRFGSASHHPRQGAPAARRQGGRSRAATGPRRGASAACARMFRACCTVHAPSG